MSDTDMAEPISTVAVAGPSTHPHKNEREHEYNASMNPHGDYTYDADGEDPSSIFAASILQNTHGLDLDAIEQPPKAILNRLLIRYVQLGYIAVVALLLEYGADPEIRVDTGDRPLHLACFMGFERVVKLLLDAGADVNTRGRMHQTPLLMAVDGGKGTVGYRGDFERWYWNLKEGFEDCDPLVKRKEKEEGKNGCVVREKRVASAAYPVSTRRVRLVQLLLDYGANVNATTDRYRHEGETSLHMAVADNDLELIGILLDHGADIEAATGPGRHTPLCIAARSNRMEVIRYLLDRGANINGRDQQDDYKILSEQGILPPRKSVRCESPLFVAAGLPENNVEAVQFLLDRGATVDLVSHKSAPLLEALRWRRSEVAQLLVEAGADVNERDEYNITALRRSIDCNDHKITSILLERGADIEARNFGGETALFTAVLRDEARSRLLLEKGANVNARDAQGNTPLSLTAYFAKPQMVRLLLDYGADTEVRNNIGETPLQRSRLSSFPGTDNAECTELLLNAGARESWKDIWIRGFRSKGRAVKPKSCVSEMSSNEVKLADLKDDSDESDIADYKHN